MTEPSPVPAPRPPADVSDGPIGLVVSVLHRADGTVVAVAGELDVATASQLVTALDEAATAGGPTVWCDLAEVTFVSVCGITALEHAQRAADERGVVLHLVAGSRPVRRVLASIDSTLVLGPDVVPEVEIESAGCSP